MQLNSSLSSRLARRGRAAMALFALGLCLFPPLQRQAQATTVALQSPTATGQQVGFEISKAIDGSTATGWAPNLLPQVAVFETVTDINNPDRTQLIFSLNHQFGSSHTIGKFRLSVTTDDRSTFADGAGNGGDVTANWTQLQTDVAFATGQPTFNINDADNTVLLSGNNPATSLYTISATTNLAGITGIRLETFEDPSLPPGGASGGPGRAANGNFVLSEFSVDQTALANNQIVFRQPSAELSQVGFPVGSAILGVGPGWANNVNGDNTMVAETKDDVGFAGGTTLSFTLDHQSPFAQHNIGTFRILATTADRSLFADNVEGNPPTPNSGQLGPDAIWSVLNPLSMSTTGQATVKINADGTVQLSGANAATDTYSFVANTDMTGITGIRLEALEDASLPSNGPGRAFNGNFVLTHFTGTADALGTSAVNIAQSAGVKVVGASSAINTPNVINDGVTTDAAGNSMFINPPLAPQGIGYDLGGWTTVDSLKVFQHSAAGGGGTRDRLESVRVHTSQGVFTFTALPDTDVIDLNLGGIETAYLFIEPVTQQGTAPDKQLGIREVQVLSTSLGISKRTNVMEGKTVTLSGAGWGPGSAPLITDGKTIWGPPLTDATSAVFNNAFSETNGWFDVDLGAVELVDRLGFMQQTFGGGGPRNMIKDLRLEFYSDAGFTTLISSLDLTLADGVVYQQLQFDTVAARYVRFNPLNQYTMGTDMRIGIVEVQLFAVPEPATLALLGIGAAALVARRRREIA